MCIGDVIVNETKIGLEKKNYMWHRIPMNPKLLVEGWNTVQLRWLNKYNTNQVGLHKYVDNKDQ